MGYSSFCKVLGRAVVEGAFLHDLQSKVIQGDSNAKIRKWVKDNENVTLNDEDIEWLRLKAEDTNKTYLQIIAAGRQAAGVNGNATLYGYKHRQ